MNDKIFCSELNPPVFSISQNKKFTTWRILRANVPNSNGNVYSLDVIKQAVDKFQKEGNKIVGHIGMLNDSETHLNEASHIVNGLKIDGEYLVAEIEVLNTLNGKILQKMMQSSKVAFRCFGAANGIIDSNGFFNVEKDYELISVNAVPVEKAAKL